jgi:hypothetical protein
VAGFSAEVDSVQKKINLLDVKTTAFEQQKSKAAGYVDEANSRVEAGEYMQAKYLYVLANDIYRKLSLKEEEAKVNEKLRVLGKLSKGKV